jgi:hypothetical protein
MFMPQKAVNVYQAKGGYTMVVIMSVWRLCL